MKYILAIKAYKIAQLAIHALTIVPAAIESKNLAIVQQKLFQSVIVLDLGGSVHLGLVPRFQVGIIWRAFGWIEGNLQGLCHVLFGKLVAIGNMETLSIKRNVLA